MSDRILELPVKEGGALVKLIVHTATFELLELAFKAVTANEYRRALGLSFQCEHLLFHLVECRKARARVQATHQLLNLRTQRTGPAQR